jgi:hypothetical protein
MTRRDIFSLIRSGFSSLQEKPLKAQNRVGVILIAGAALAGCAAVPEGTPQEIGLSVAPEMAKCDAYQHGNLVGTYDANRKTIALRSSRGSADIVCTAPGYKDIRVSIVPDEGAFGHFFGAVVADFGPVNYFRNAYPPSVQIAMERAPA